MAKLELTTTATIPSSNQTIDITIYEDADGDGTAENSATQTIDNGTNTYVLSGFDASSGNDIWFETSNGTSDYTTVADLNTVDITKALDIINVPVTSTTSSTPEPTVNPGPVTINTPISQLSSSTPEPSVNPGPVTVNVPVTSLDVTTPAPRFYGEFWIVNGELIKQVTNERIQFDSLELRFRTSRDTWNQHLQTVGGESGKVEMKAITGGRFRAFDISLSDGNTYVLRPPYDRRDVAPGGTFHAKTFNSSITGPRNNQRDTRIVFIPDEQHEPSDTYISETRGTGEWLFDFDQGAISTRNVDGENISEHGKRGLESKRVTLLLNYDQAEVIFEVVTRLADDGVERLEPDDGESRIIDNTSGRNTVQVTSPPSSEFSGSENPDDILSGGEWIVESWTGTWEGGYYEVTLEMAQN